MTRRLIGATLHAVLLLFIVTTSADALEWARDKISIVADLLDEQAEGAYEFTNAGSAPVTILTVRSSCGCTVPNLDKRRYEPGEHGTLKAVFEFGGRIGLQKKTITVTTDESDSSTYELALEVEIPKLFEVERHFVIWRRGDAAEPKSIEIQVLKPGLMKLTNAVSRDERFQTVLKTTDDPAIYQVIVTPSQTEKAVQSAIVVSTDFPEEDPRVITVYGLVR